MGTLWILLDAFNILTLGWFVRQVTEDEIVRNVRFLKEEESVWYQERFANGKFRKLIIHDWEVRTMIGQFEPEKMKKLSYLTRQQKRIDRILIKKVNALVQ
ncbi:hypothetical protein FITA111629_08315 [Filibacter tadaridae]|uniref:Uncharacterized protein n=1 Tax=Filibacter tadaridae TaxID=2483811 RepID=A0A3P5XBU7_9BACL|nr:hypothetical protein [Filibacter tadaridae]VDC25929.1 hypothetical protein FILTAD_01368 [Filibacter tadaridae]